MIKHGILTSTEREKEKVKEERTLKAPQVPALMRMSGCKAWIEAKVMREAGTVPTLSIPAPLIP